MAFLLSCPNCGKRSIYEFHSGGEFLIRPKTNSAHDECHDYHFLRENQLGDVKEWWYHAFGCKRWFIAIRNTLTNKVITTYLNNGEKK